MVFVRDDAAEDLSYNVALAGIVENSYVAQIGQEF